MRILLISISSTLEVLIKSIIGNKLHLILSINNRDSFFFPFVALERSSLYVDICHVRKHGKMTEHLSNMKMAWCAAKEVVQNDNGKGKLAPRASDPNKQLMFPCFIYNDRKFIHKDWDFIYLISIWYLNSPSKCIHPT